MISKMFLRYFIILGIFSLVSLEESGAKNDCSDEKDFEAGLAFDACVNKTPLALETWYATKYGIQIKPFVPRTQDKCVVTSHIVDCLDKRINYIKGCSNFKGNVKQYTIDKKMETEFLKHVCPNIDEITRVFNTTQPKCMPEGFNKTFRKCGEKLTITPDDILKIDEKCSELKSLATCFNTTITEYCPEEVRELSMRIGNNITSSLCPTTGK